MTTVEVIVKLTPDAATRSGPEHKELQAHADQLGVSLEPLHPSASDPELVSYAVAHVDQAVADDVLEQLRSFAGVEAAYAKAAGEPPERRAPDVQQP